MKMLVTGAHGAVGSYVEDVFGARHNLVLTDRDTLDITDRRATFKFFRSHAPHVVLHLAAATDVDECERYPEFAWRTNAIGTQNVALACGSDTKLVYVSTAGVFGGEKAVYNEFDEAVPANVYGRSKLEGERFALRHQPECLIVRSGWMFGGQGLDKKFVGKIQQQIFAGAEDIYAVDDKYGSPTYAKDLLRAIQRLLDVDAVGVFHAANEGITTRYGVAREIVKILGVGHLHEVQPAKSTLFPLPAPRAESEAMDSLMMRLIGVEPSRSWRAALAEYLAE